MKHTWKGIFLLLILLAVPNGPCHDQTLDERVQSFLDRHQHQWADLNIPMRDGQLLYDLIVENNYTRALEIGTSTGHSGIWIAWALSKTGGKLITLEINESRHREALANFREAGLIDFVDARMGDAHQLVKTIEGPFDFVFSDADKTWYKQYFIDVDPKLVTGGCFTAHNIPGNPNRRYAGIREFVEYIQSLPNYDTEIETKRSSGISISYKRAE